MPQSIGTIAVLQFFFKKHSLKTLVKDFLLSVKQVNQAVKFWANIFDEWESEIDFKVVFEPVKCDADAKYKHELTT